MWMYAAHAASRDDVALPLARPPPTLMHTPLLAMGALRCTVPQAVLDVPVYGNITALQLFRPKV